MRRSQGGVAVVESLMLGLQWLTEVGLVDDGVAPVEDHPLSLPRIGARR